MHITSILTRQSRANTVADRWRKRYANSMFEGTFIKNTFDMLKELGPNPDPDEVNALVGNSNWINIYCSMCKESVSEVLKFEHDFVEIRLCKLCLEKSLKTLEGN